MAYSNSGTLPGQITYVLPGDNAATIQSKLSSIQPGNSLVFVGGATYDFGGVSMVGKSGITVWADGQVIIKNAPGTGTHGAFNFSGQTDWTIGGKAPGQGFVLNGSLIDATNAGGNWAIGNCQFNNQQSNGYDGAAIRMDGASSGTIINNDFTAVGGNVLGMYNLNNIVIDGNHFTNCVEPISIQEPTNANTSLGHDIVIQRNVFLGTQRAAIEVGPASSGSEYFSGLVVNNNYFDNFNNTAGPGTLLAISLVGQSSQNSTITNNFIRRGPADAGEVGVAIEMTGTGVVAGNTIANFSYAALTYQSGWNVHDNTIYNDVSSPYFGFANNGSGSGSFGPETVLTGLPPTPAMPARLAWDSSASGTVDPPVVSESLAKDTGQSTTDRITSSGALTGTSDANAVIHFTLDGTALAGTAKADASGAWTFKPTALSDGNHTVIATEINSIGVSGSASLTYVLDTKAPVPLFTKLAQSNGLLKLSGSDYGVAGEKVSLYDGKSWIGETTTAGDGSFSFTTAADPAMTHAYGVIVTDIAGNVGEALGQVLLGTRAADVIVGSAAANLIQGSNGSDMLTGGGGKDTFVYRAVSNSTDTITDFVHGVDKIDFTRISGVKTSDGIPQFQGKMASTGHVTLNAHSVGLIESGGSTLVLVNTSGSAEIVSAADTHAADMKIVLVGINLGVTASDFHRS